ncbi:MAG: MBL fold metallo-hydrolase [Planctomycetes bacterium]|nr:MBL fold metallo-hydrolase [Planctomycetota bacterium]
MIGILLFCGIAYSANRGVRSVLVKDNSIRITIVYDNNPYKKGLETAWGFGCLVEGLEKTILFDTGGEGDILMGNMKKLHIDPNDVDTVVISHIHHDHCGGLSSFLRQNHDVKVYLPNSFPDSMKDGVGKAGAKVIGVQGPAQICSRVYSTGELGRAIKEQSLLIETGKGLVVITGCSHPGIVSILKEAKKQRHKGIHLVLGGFHLFGTAERRLRGIVRDFQSENVRFVAPVHCSGKNARRSFEKSYGSRCLQMGVGARLRVPVLSGVALLAGEAATKAPDVEAALRLAGIHCEKISARDIRKGALKNCSVLIVPGGRTAKMVDALGKEGYEQIRDFAAAGGGYVGICAGAYIGAPTVDVPGSPDGLGLLRVENHRRSGKSMKTIEIVDTRHPVTAGCPHRQKIYYQNGPLIEPGKNVKMLARYEDGGGAIVCGNRGKGRIVIFSPHPEGSLEKKVNPAETGTLKLLENAVEYVLQSEGVSR